MFNVAIIRLKDLIKGILFVFLIICLIFFSKNILEKKKSKKFYLDRKKTFGVNQYVKQAINIELPERDENKDNNTYKKGEQSKEKSKEKSERKHNKILESIISLELGIVELKEKAEDVTKISDKDGQNVEEKNNEDNKKELELAKDNVHTEIITENPIVDAYNKKINGVKIKNETSYDLEDKDLKTDKLKIDKSNIIIFHTHTCESYTSSKEYSYIPTGKFRTTDLNFSVVRVGEELSDYLKKYDLNVIHNKTCHDFPSYTGSYSRSLSTISGILKNKNADIIIDIHRDAIGSYSSYAPMVKIGDDECAQLMFVIGTDGGKLKHPNWRKNLQFAIKVQEKANKEYPGLFKPIILRNSRYNQHLGKAACIIEVGATGNKMEQALNSMKYLSKILNEI